MRVFIAIDIEDESIKDIIAKEQARILSLGIYAKPIKHDQLHFTLMFLGEISISMLESIKEHLRDMKFKAVNVTYKGIGAFPDARSARIIWLGVDDESAKELRNIAMMIEDRLARLGFRSDKTFSPHVTILRVKDRANITSILKNDIFGRELLDKIKVKKSELTPDGPIYSDLFTISAG